MAGFAGLATGFLELYLMRMLMGVFEGAYAPVSIAATTVSPERLNDLKTKSDPWRTIFLHRNVVIGTLALVGTMSCIFVICAIMPSYLIDYLKLGSSEMGFVTSAIGFFGAAGQILMGAI
jgi:hypothetical protein